MTASPNETIVITGGTGGIGFQSALTLAKSGARLVITGRSPESGQEAVQRIVKETGNSSVEFVAGDLSSMAGVDAVAAALVERLDAVDVLVNNAGYMGNAPAESEDGFEMHFAVNVLAPWRLSQALLGLLGEGARIVNVTGGNKPAEIDPENLQAEKGFRGLLTYGHSKSAMEAMSMMLADQLRAEGVTVNVVFPGRASTAMTSALSLASLPGPLKLAYPLFRLMFRPDDGKSAKKASRSTVWAATSAELTGLTGLYFDANSKPQDLHATAHDTTIQGRIRALIEDPPSR